MSPRSNIFMLLTLVMVMSFFIVILMNIFNNGQSLYYKNEWTNSYVNQAHANVMDEAALLKSAGGDGYDDSFSEYRNQEPDDDQLFSEIERILPNIPFGYMQRHKKHTMQKGKNCAVLPKLHRLRHYNNYWQTYTVGNVTMQLYAAYYDSRPDVPGGPVVRILAMINQRAAVPTTFCHIWHENQTYPDIVAVEEYKSIWKFGGSNIFFPFLLTCRPSNATFGIGTQRIPQAVALVERTCFVSTNILKVIYNNPNASANKFDFAICVKGLDFPYADISFRLVEWLELHRLLGVHKVFMYDIALHPNVRKVLSYYQAEGFVDLQPITLVGGLVNIPNMQHWILRFTLMNKRQNELVPYNDCFYRHMYQYNYIALVDVDEVIMPLGELKTWHDIIEVSHSHASSKTHMCPQGYAGICFRNTYFPFDISSFNVSTTKNTRMQTTPSAPDFMFMLNHQYRTSNYSKKGSAVKCLHSTAKTLTLHNHYSVERLSGCMSFDFPRAEAHLQHYHDMNAGKDFNAVLVDNAMARYKDELIQETSRVLQQVGLLT